MSGRTRTPIFSFDGFDTPSRRTTSSNRSRASSAREVLNGVVNAGTTPPLTPASTTDHVDSSSHTGSITGTGHGDTSVTNAVKNLRDQQKKLQASTARIEEMLKQLTENHEKKVTASVRRPSIPRALSRIVHDVYEKLLDEQEEMRWNLQEGFDHVSNRQVNTTLIRNIQGVLKDNEYDPTMIKRAARTYFKSKKSDHQRERSGKKASTAALSRKRQRRHNKARARLRVLNLSKNIDEASRKKAEPVLIADLMSSEDSEYEDVVIEQGQSSGSELEDVPAVKKKKLIKHKPPWRSREMQSVLDSLDRKIDRRRDARAKKMCLEVVMGADSTRPKPDGMPEWAMELFS